MDRRTDPKWPSRHRERGFARRRLITKVQPTDGDLSWVVVDLRDEMGNRGTRRKLAGALLRLPIGLGVVPRREANRGPNPTTKGLPHLRRKLGATVGDNVLGDTVQPDHMGDEEIRRFGRGREFRQGGEVDHLGKSVDYSQDGIFALGGRETGHEVQGNVRPWPCTVTWRMWRGWSRPAGGQTSQTNSRTSVYREGHQKRRRMNWAVWTAPGWQANRLEWPHCRTLLRMDAGTKRQFRPPRIGLGALGLVNSRLEPPGDHSYDLGWWEDGMLVGVFRLGLSGEETGQGVGTDILGARTERQREIKSAEKEGPARLPGTEPLRIADVC